MRDGKPSFTAAAVAAARAIAGVDAIAPGLVDGALGWLVRAGRGSAAGARVINVGAFGLVDHLELRTRAIDAAVREGLAGGAAQLVLLGAGLDARAWRMPELAGVEVFEVDHPSTQAYKRARIGQRAPAAARVRFVAVDFARDALDTALAAAGHDPRAATFWIWEGVTPYLPLPATRATLATVGARSAAGSRLAVTYVTPDATPLGDAVTRLGQVGFRLFGEAILGSITEAEMHRELGAVGLRVLDDSSARDWGRRHGGGRGRLLLVHERLCVALSGERPPATPGA